MTEPELRILAAQFTREYGELISATLGEILQRGDMFVICYFRNINCEGEPGVLSALRSNIMDKDAIIERVTGMLDGLKETEIVDLRDVQGGMQ